MSSFERGLVNSDEQVTDRRDLLIQSTSVLDLLREVDKRWSRIVLRTRHNS